MRLRSGLINGAVIAFSTGASDVCGLNQDRIAQFKGSASQLIFKRRIEIQKHNAMLTP
jgi:hypothetical protein